MFDCYRNTLKTEDPETEYSLQIFIVVVFASVLFRITRYFTTHTRSCITGRKTKPNVMRM